MTVALQIGPKQIDDMKSKINIPKQATRRHRRRRDDALREVQQVHKRKGGGKKLVSRQVIYKPPEARGLNEKQMRFCEEYIVDLNPKAAAIRAGYSAQTANDTARKILDSVPGKRYIAHLKVERAKKLEVSQERIVEELARICYADHRTFYDKDGWPIPLDMITDDQQSAIRDIAWQTRDVYDFVYDENGQKKFDEKGQPETCKIIDPTTGLPKTVRVVSKYFFYNREHALRMLGHHIGMSFDKPAEKLPPATLGKQEVDFDELIRKLNANQLEKLTEIMLFAARAQVNAEQPTKESNELPEDHWSKQTNDIVQ
jgi:hypothetical protein